MSFITKIGAKVPAVRAFEQSVTNSTAPLNDIRSQLWKLRSQYWYRRINEFPAKYQSSKSEIKELLSGRITKPAEWTWGDAISAGVVGTQLFGCFAIGEVLSRNKLWGYNIGNAHH